MNPILGEVHPDFAGEVLATGYQQFYSACGLDGLFKESNDGTELNLLAVTARHKKTGAFRTFVSQAKSNYQVIRLLEVWNPTFETVLTRYGFRHAKYQDGNEILDAMEWKIT